MSDLRLGNIITTTQQRDAIHVAVAPVRATQELMPGQRIGLVHSSTEDVQATSKPIGIVDPFLEAPVQPGQRCWMFLMPNTITSLRHDWVHPAFGQEEVSLVARKESEKWLLDYATRMNSYDPPDVAFRRLLDGLKAQHLDSHGCSSLYGRHDLDAADELKEHAERYLGISIDWEHFRFSCSC